MLSLAAFRALFAAALIYAGLAAGLRVIAAGDSIVRGDLIARATVRKRMVLVRGDSEHVVGWLTQTIGRSRWSGRRALLSVQTFADTGGVITTTDSAWAEPQHLRPLAQRSHGSHREMRLDFHGDSVTGQVLPDSGGSAAIAADPGLPVFDANTVDLVIAALPLAPGFRAKLPTYIYEEGGGVWYEITAVRSDTATIAGERRAVWLVSVTTGTKVVRYTIDRRTRRVLRSEYSLPHNTVLRIEQVAAGVRAP